jgi:hypothetical protein
MEGTNTDHNSSLTPLFLNICTSWGTAGICMLWSLVMEQNNAGTTLWGAEWAVVAIWTLASKPIFAVYVQDEVCPPPHEHNIKNRVRPATKWINYIFIKWNARHRQHGMEKYVFLYQSFLRPRTFNLWTALNTVIGSRTSQQSPEMRSVFGIWRIGRSIGLALHYFCINNGSYCRRFRIVCRFSWPCNLHYKQTVPPWIDLFILFPYIPFRYIPWKTSHSIYIVRQLAHGITNIAKVEKYLKTTVITILR